MKKQAQQFIPGYPYGDPGGNWQLVDEDFYKFVDEAFDNWHDTQRARSNMNSCMPYELTALEPEGRVVAWKDRKHLSRSDHRKINPEVAAEIERLEAMRLDGNRPAKEDCQRPFSPSPLTCFRAGFSEGLNREKRRHNADWGHNLEKYPDGRDGWAFNVLKRTVQSKGMDFVRELLDKVVASLEAEAAEGGERATLLFPED